MVRAADAMVMRDLYVIDANFFISLAQTRERGALDLVLDHARDLGWEMHVTEPILGEVRTVRCKGTRHTAAELARAVMEVHDADEAAVAAIRMELGGADRSPQAPDLSLMALSRSLAEGGANVRLVSDDFKISLTSRDLGMPYAVISPSVFLFSLSRELHGRERARIRQLYRKVRHGEMEYLLSRRDLYNVEEKLTWLMDNLIQTVMLPGAAREEARGTGSPSAATAAGGPAGGDGREEDWEALMRHLRGERVRKGHLKPFEGILPHLEPLTAVGEALRGVNSLAESGDLEGAMALAHAELSDLKSQLQLAVAAHDLRDGQRVLRAYAELLPDLEMVVALLHVNLGQVVDCEDHLDNVALLALAAGLSRTTIDANYLEALVHAYREAWEDALSQFQLTARLSEQAGDPSTGLRCMIGTAVMQLLSGDAEGAEGTMGAVNALVEEDPASGSLALEEFGDHFTNFGATHLAAGLYDEALECAVEAALTEDAERLMMKLRRSRLSMGLEDRDMASALRTLIDHANDIQDAELLERYRRLEEELTGQLESMEEPLPRTFDEWEPVYDLPGQLRGWLEIMRADSLPQGEGTLLVTFTKGLGNVGVLVKDRLVLPGIEHAAIKMDTESRVKLVEAPEPFRSGDRLRGLVVLHEGDRYELKRSLISLRGH